MSIEFELHLSEAFGYASHSISFYTINVEDEMTKQEFFEATGLKELGICKFDKGYSDWGEYHISRGPECKDSSWKKAKEILRELSLKSFKNSEYQLQIIRGGNENGR